MPRPTETPSLFAAARSVFEAAWPLPPDQREAFVRERCERRGDLASYVLELLRNADHPTIALWNGGARGLGASEPIRSAAVDELLEKLQSAPRLAAERYQLDGEVGRGGMGVVLRYRDLHLHRPVALKTMLLPDASTTAGDSWLRTQLLGRFLAEAQVTSQLEHPGVIPVHELGLDQDGQAYFTMRLVSGREAHEVFALARQKQQGWTLARALEVILKVCDTMAYAHQRGVVHRDLKPRNVMVGEFGEVYVMDWGLAKARGTTADGATAAATAPARPGIDTVRQHDAEQAPGSPLQSLRGQRVGTPNYMSPEQAEGVHVDERSDVYAIGAMLYELLTGRAPYARPGESVTAEQVLTALRQGPPTPVTELAQALPPELVAIVDKGMAREPQHRYPGPRELAADLRAFLDQRSVGAYQTGALVELKLWIRRNRPLAGSLAAALLLLVVGTVLVTAFAKDVEAAAAERDASNRSLDQLAALLRGEAAADEVAMLVPAWPQRLPDLEAWLQNSAVLERVYASLAAEPATAAAPVVGVDAETRANLDRRIGLYEAYVRSLRQSQARREAGTSPPVVELTAEQLAMDAKAKAACAMRCVAPTAEARTEVGQEALGLALATAAVRENQDPTLAADLLGTLAFAQLAIGDDAAAMVSITSAYDAAEPVRQGEFNLRRLHIKAHRAQLPKLIGEAETALAELQTLRQDRERSAQNRALFTADSRTFVDAKRNEIVAKLQAFARRERPLVERRLVWAQQIAAATRAHPAARASWDDARAAIAHADGITASERYAGQSIPLADADVYGLVPLGMNPVTKLWEFYDLRSAWDGVMQATAIPLPERDPVTGDIRVTEATGIVFVLLPGGEFTMGAQSGDPMRPNFDPQASGADFPHALRLAPFLMARHEMSQAQWRRLWTGADELGRPSQFLAGVNYRHGAFTAVNPVENVSAAMAKDLLRQHGLLLPTEAQWEYACRAGTGSVWYTGDQQGSLSGHENCHDQTSAPALGRDGAAPFKDGFLGHAPVGSFAANAFGLHDMHGNVAEWCLDWFDGYEFATRPGDGLRLVMRHQSVVFRGGAYGEPPSNCRSAFRRQEASGFRSSALGVRACRSLRPMSDPE